MALAARGSRQLSENVEQIEDPRELSLVRKQARKVQIESLIAGLLITLITMFIP